MEVRSEVDRKLAEKDEKMEQIKRNKQRLIDSMLSIPKPLVNCRDVTMWIKMKIKRDMNEMKIQLRKTNHQAAESQKRLRYVQKQLKIGYGPLVQRSCSQKAATNCNSSSEEQ